MEDKIKSNNLSMPLVVSEGIFLGIITALGYVLAYYYDLGYKSYFHIPTIFIDVSPTKIIVAVASILSSFFIIYPAVNIFPAFYPKSKEFRFLFILFSVYLIIALLLNHDWTLLLPYTIVLFIFIFLFYIFPIVEYWKVPGYKNKLEKSFQKEINIPTLSDYFHVKGLAVLIIILVGLPLVQTYGISNAKKQNEFIIIKKPSTFVVLDSYKDCLVVAPVDLNLNLITPEYKIIDSKSTFENPVDLEVVKVGRLTIGE